MVQDIPLARALHAACEIGQEIPLELYNAVARVLAFVMQLKAGPLRGRWPSGRHPHSSRAADGRREPRPGTGRASQTQSEGGAQMNRNLSKLAVPVGVVGIILLLIVPIPAALLDVLIIVNILLALVMLLTTMFVRKPLDFSVFPSLLLVATLFRLGLNVASTRLVLGEGYAGAGHPGVRPRRRRRLASSSAR